MHTDSAPETAKQVEEHKPPAAEHRLLVEEHMLVERMVELHTAENTGSHHRLVPGRNTQEREHTEDRRMAVNTTDSEVGVRTAAAMVADCVHHTHRLLQHTVNDM